jgi:large subunit ribosomal protein L32e
MTLTEIRRSARAAGPRISHHERRTSTRRRLLSLRRTIDDRRPVFGRQAANRYWRIGRDGAWRRPRGLQSKQRRHYGYRAELVSIGYRSPAAVRGLAPNGFRPVIVETTKQIDALDPVREAAVIARTVGTRRRLTLEDAARQKGIHVLNPIVTSEREA